MTTQQKFDNWLDNIVNIEKPSNDTIVFCLGIYESSDSYEAYLIGSKVFDDTNYASARNVHFAPKNRYFSLGWNGGDPQIVLDNLKKYLTDYFQSPNFKDSFLEKATAIVYSHDKDTLYRLK